MLGFLDERERRWTAEVVERRPQQRASEPDGQLLAIFDEFRDWFKSRSDYEACSFIKVLLEMGPEGRIGEACLTHLDRVREVLRSRAELAGLRDPKSFAWELNIVLKGSIVCAAEGDPDAAERGKAIAAWLIDQHRVQPAG